MLKLAPPVWTFLYLIIAGAVHWLYPWRVLANLPLVWLGLALARIGFAISFGAVSLFRREGTELNPASETNKLLVVCGSFRFTRNPMYLGLVIFTLGICILGGGAAHVRSFLARVRGDELGAYSIRGGENAAGSSARLSTII